jgi:hypothetical protein
MHIEPLTSTLVESALRTAGLRFLTNPEGDFICMFRGPGDFALDAQITIEGSAKDILCVRCLTPNYLPDFRGPRLQQITADWNRDMRWPKAYLHTRDDRTGIRVVGEHQLLVTGGVHQELVAGVIQSAIAGASRLFENITTEFTEPNFNQLEAWLRDAS